jgi:hypothetical protein
MHEGLKETIRIRPGHSHRKNKPSRSVTTAAQTILETRLFSGRGCLWMPMRPVKTITRAPAPAVIEKVKETVPPGILPSRRRSLASGASMTLELSQCRHPE